MSLLLQSLLLLDIVGMAASLKVAGAGGTVLAWLFGWPILILPGICLAALFYRSSLRHFDLAERMLFYLILSLSLLPLPLSALSLLGRFPLTGRTAAYFYLAELIVFWLLLAVQRFAFATSLRSGDLLPAGWKFSSVPRWWVAGFGMGLLFLVANMLLYRYLPEADPYGWGIVIKAAQQSGHLPAGITRVFFVYSMQTLVSVTGIPVYWLFKVVLPFLVWLVAALFAGSLLSRQVLEDRLKAALLLLPLAVPVFTEELLVSRPQTIAVILFLSLTLLMPTAAKARQLDILLTGTLIAALSFRYHELGGFLFLVCLAISLWAYRKEIAASPKHSALAIGSFACLALASVWPTSIGAYLRANLHDLLTALAAHQFRWWFINHYVNTDGIEVGWPGWQAALYYGYNLGMAVPLLVLAWLVWVKKKSWRSAFASPLTFSFGLAAALFFVIAEVFPRLGYYQLPDRAWIFLMMAVMGLTLSDCGRLLSLLRQRRVQGVFLLALAGSLAVALYITYAKQGRVSANEYAASQFLLKNTPANAAVFSQSSNQPAISFFAGRTLLVDDRLFQASTTPDQLRSELESQLQSVVPSGSGAGDQLGQDIVREAAKAPSLTSDGLLGSRERLDGYYASLIDLRLKQEEVQGQLGPRPEVYLLFSTDKFKGLYATRQWWLEENYVGFKPASFQNLPFLQLVYSNDSVYIWKVLRDKI